jgi:hypothetical protein
VHTSHPPGNGGHHGDGLGPNQIRSSALTARPLTRLEMPIACNADKRSRRNPRRSFAPIVVLRLNQTLLSVQSAGLRWLRPKRGNGLRSLGCDVHAVVRGIPKLRTLLNYAGSPWLSVFRVCVENFVNTATSEPSGRCTMVHPSCHMPSSC